MAGARRTGFCAGLALLLAATSALAQADRPKRRPQPPPVAAPAGDNTTGEAGSDAASPAAARPKPSLRPAPVRPTLRSAVRSRWSRPAGIAASTTAQCRLTCATQRSTCAQGELSGSDTSGCDPGWMQCLSACEGLTYKRGP